MEFTKIIKDMVIITTNRNGIIIVTISNVQSES